MLERVIGADPVALAPSLAIQAPSSRLRKNPLGCAVAAKPATGLL
jgi:hypothetical protein